MGNAAAKEPSMEDILSSIRKIVSQEDEAADAEGEGVPSAKAVEVYAQEQPVAPAASFAKLAHQVRAKAARAERYEVPSPPPVALDDEEIDFNAGLHTPQDEEAESGMTATIATPNPQELEMNSQADTMATQEMEDREEQTMSDADHASGPHEGKASGEDGDFREALVSASTQHSVSDSFERMKRSVLENIDARMDAMMRPMLSDWLDENLPGIVERIVHEEVEKLAKID
jgi:uncharacterized protein